MPHYGDDPFRYLRDRALGRVGAGAGQDGGPGWWDPSALIDADFENSRYRFNGVNYSSLAAFTAAIGASAVGSVLTVGPYDPGLPALYQSDFSGGVDGWTETLNPANGDLAALNNALRLTVTASYGVTRAISVASPIAALLTGTCLGRSGPSSLALAGGSVANLGANGSASISFGSTFPATRSVVIGSAISALYAGLSLGGTGTADYDSISVKQVQPYAGYTNGELSYEVDFTAPAASGNKALLQWGVADEDHRVRLVYDASGNVRQITTYSNSEGSNIDLGVVGSGTRHTVKGSAKTNLMYANIDGGVVGVDTTAQFPGLGLFWIGRSVTGETFDGTINRVKVYAAAVANPDQLVTPSLGLRSAGDSTADGTGATVDWYEVLASSYTPSRSWSKNAVGGDNTTQLLARMQAQSAFYNNWTTIFMERPNTGETASAWLDNIAACGALITAGRWLVVPPCQDVPDTGITNITEVQQRLLTDPRFAGRTFDASTQTAYFAALSGAPSRSDGTHFSDAGQATQASYVKSWLDAKGW